MKYRNLIMNISYLICVFCLLFLRVANGFPDMRSCLLNQKLQMLNICMERKNIREGKLPFSMQLMGKQEGKTDSDDEFFDCDDDRVVDDEGTSMKYFENY